ncbi:unnamed protein product, partial [Meganyctiphanes norvegica]
CVVATARLVNVAKNTSVNTKERPISAAVFSQTFIHQLITLSRTHSINNMLKITMKLVQLLVMTVGVQEVLSITCYKCTNDILWKPHFPYDPECGLLNYDGHTHTANYSEFDYCTTILWMNGAVSRTIFEASNSFDDGECREYSDEWWECICVGDSCNTGSYCEQCNYPWVPPKTTAR